MSITSLSNQSVQDLLNERAMCYVDKDHHLQGALQVPLQTEADVVRMAAAVETRLTRGTKMNDTSSRSHCVTVFTLSVLREGTVQQSRLQFFDLMGSARFKGDNAAHDSTQSSKSTEGGWEGIYANLSLSSLMAAVEGAAKARRAKTKKRMANPVLGFALTELLDGSLSGSALTAMITCVSQAPRNGDETFLSLSYAARMANLTNAPEQQPQIGLERLFANAQRQYETSAAIVRKGVKGKYQALRQAEVRQWEQILNVLGALNQ